MTAYKDDFITLAIEAEALKFGQYTLKSGRVSPYFFNAGAFSRASQLDRLARAYAAAIKASQIEFDIVFGPAYKGIPLAALIARALFAEHGMDVGFTYNRKEAKNHGEGGHLVGAELKGRVLIVDDVISAGTAARQSIAMIRQAGASPVALAVALDRQEIGPKGLSAIEELVQDEQLQVIAVATLTDLQHHLSDQPGMQAHAEAIRAYRNQYGSK
jgi:orotate phosphoribosyltransferase